MSQNFKQASFIIIFIRLNTLKDVNFNPQSKGQLKPIFSRLN